MKKFYCERVNAHFDSDKPFVLDDEQYPAGWIDASSPEWLESQGMIEVTDLNRPEGEAADESLNFITSALVGPNYVWSSTPKPPEILAAKDAEEVESKKVQIRAIREPYLGRILGIKDAARDVDDTDTVDACKLVRQALLDLTKDLPTDPALVDAEVVQRYTLILAMCTPMLISAFNGQNE